MRLKILANGGGRSNTYIYSPSTDSFGTGPSASGGLEIGSFGMQSILDGSYLVVHGIAGDGMGSSLYGASCALSGYYLSEPIEVQTGMEFVTLGWEQGPGSEIGVSVRFAETATELASASFIDVENGVDLGEVRSPAGPWLQVRFDYSRQLPRARVDREAMERGRAWVSYVKDYAQPTIRAWWVDYE